MEHQRRANGKEIPAEVLKQRRRERGMQAVYIALVIAIVIAFYCAVSTAVTRFNWKLDLTENQVFQITDTTKDILENLDQEVSIIYCNAREAADSNIEEVLNRYAARTPFLTVEYVDLDSNPAFVEDYAKRNISLSVDGVLVLSGQNAQFISWNELYEIKTYTDSNGKQKYSLTGLRAETQLTSAIVKVTTQQAVGLAFTAGHSEDVPDALKELLISSNYTVDQVVLGVDPIADHVKTVIIAGAAKDFSESEIRQLETFMERGGNLVVFRNPKVETLPNLDGYLREWGLTVEDQMVLEPRQQMDSPLNIIPSFGLSMINVYFSEHSTYLVLPESRQITLSNTNQCITNEVLRSTSSSYGKSFRNMETLERTADDVSGPFTVAATSERTYDDENGETKTQYVFLTACTGFYQESYLKTDSLGNADLVLQVLAYLNDSAVTLNIPAKTLAANNISISWASTVAFAAVFVVLLPLALLTVGITMFLKRRHA